jgi:hypothetical protein
MAKSNSTAATIKESKADTLNRTSREIGRSFAKASQNVDRDSVSAAALTRLTEYAEMWQEIRSDLEAHAINSGFCEGVADQLRRAEKAVQHG